MRRRRRWIVRSLVVLIVAFAGWRAWKQHVIDTTFANAPAELRECLSKLPEDVVGYVVAEGGGQAASWGKKYVGLCDAYHEAETNNWARKGAYVLEKRGISTAAFIDADLWMGFSGRLEHLGFGPPTGGDGALYLYGEDSPPIAIDLDGAPVALMHADNDVIAISASGRTATVPIYLR